MCDEGNKHCSGERTGCTQTGPYAKKAFIRLRTGYGIAYTAYDGDQTKTDCQYLQLMSPQKDNLIRGPHVLHMQERAHGPGQVFLRAGGDYIITLMIRWLRLSGVEKDNPSDKMEFVSKNKLVSVKDVYYNKCGTAVFWADDYVFLLAGQDCQDENGNGQPCVYPVAYCANQYQSLFGQQRVLEHQKEFLFRQIDSQLIHVKELLVILN